MLSELDVGDYVDYKGPQNDWVVARIIEKENDMIKIKIDGFASKNEFVKKC
jgi:hypothetical protein